MGGGVGWLEKLKIKLSQVVVEVEVGVELGKMHIFFSKFYFILYNFCKLC